MDGFPAEECTASRKLADQEKACRHPTIEEALKLPEGSYQREEFLHQLLNNMVRQDPKRALELSLQLPTRQRNTIARSAVRELVKTDLDAAVAFFDKHIIEFAVMNGDAFTHTYYSLANRNLAGAEKVLALADDPRCREPAPRLREVSLSALLRLDSPERAYREASKFGGPYVRKICRKWLHHDRAGFLDWMKQSPENKVHGLVALIEQSSEQAPFKAAQYISELDPLGYENSSHQWRWEIKKIFSLILKLDEKFALDWAKNLKSRNFTVPVWYGVASHLAKSDPDASAKWIASLPPGSGRKAAAQGFLQSKLQNARVYDSPFSISSTAFKADTFGKYKE